MEKFLGGIWGNLESVINNLIALQQTNEYGSDIDVAVLALERIQDKIEIRSTTLKLKDKENN